MEEKKDLLRGTHLWAEVADAHGRLGQFLMDRHPQIKTSTKPGMMFDNKTLDDFRSQLEIERNQLAWHEAMFHLWEEKVGVFINPD